ncbi:GFA family protein [Nitratireductor sp. XY-223]|uniref:GFA family protein n=1 Tax=Nitratireductor sp. XY-223 TaxID=2561926 RepID=UPI0010A9EC9B|nr:GFA family protein [Nitratireductor sp. XY-223]
MGEIHEGGCVCGRVRYRTSGEPKRVSLCSCEWCTKRTGSALGVSVYFAEDDVEFLSGNLKSHRLNSDAGRWIDSQFCEDCGTVLTWTLEFLPGHRGIAGGTFDPPTFWFEPERYVFTRSKPAWLNVPDGITCFAGMPGSASE